MTIKGTDGQKHSTTCSVGIFTSSLQIFFSPKISLCIGHIFLKTLIEAHVIFLDSILNNGHERI